MQARADETLQEWGWRHAPPENINAMPGCPECRRVAMDLAWTFYIAPSRESSEAGSVQGWIIACPRCQKQAGFLPIPPR